MSQQKTNERFSVELPEGWEDQTVHLFMGPEDNGIQHSLGLTIDSNEEELDIEDYSQVRIDQMLETLQGIEILKKEMITLSNGNPVCRCIFKWIPVEDQIIFRKVVFMILDGSGYTFTANFSKKTLKTIGVEVDMIIDSFQPELDGSETE